MAGTVTNLIDKSTQIVSAAENLFLNEGYGVTSMDRIAQAAGVTKQTVYRYFPSKEALFVAVMEQTRATEVEPYTFNRADLGEELFHYGVQLLRFHLRPKVLGLYRLMLTEGARQSGLATAFKQTGPRGFIEPLTIYLRSHNKLFPDPEFAARMFCTMVLAPRANLLIGSQQTLTASAQEAHVRQVVAFFNR